MGLLVGHGSCIMGHGSLSAWVTGSWVNASDPLPALFLMSGGSSFQSRGAATLNARSPSLSLVRGTTRSPFEADRSWGTHTDRHTDTHTHRQIISNTTWSDNTDWSAVLSERRLHWSDRCNVARTRSLHPAVTEFSVYDTIRYGTIRYDTVYLHALKSWREGQLIFQHRAECCPLRADKFWVQM